MEPIVDLGGGVYLNLFHVATIEKRSEGGDFLVTFTTGRAIDVTGPQAQALQRHLDISGNNLPADHLASLPPLDGSEAATTTIFPVPTNTPLTSGQAQETASAPQQ